MGIEDDDSLVTPDRIADQITKINPVFDPRVRVSLMKGTSREFLNDDFIEGLRKSLSRFPVAYLRDIHSLLAFEPAKQKMVLRPKTFTGSCEIIRWDAMGTAYRLTTEWLVVCTEEEGLWDYFEVGDLFIPLPFNMIAR